MKLAVTSYFQCDMETCVAEILKVRLLNFVARPLIVFRPIEPGQFPDRWEKQHYLVAMRLFGVIPLGRQTIGIEFPPRSAVRFQMMDHGSSRVMPTWDHLMTIEKHGGESRYTDSVNIKAGLLTPLIWVLAWIFFRHRQRRWKKLIASGFAYE